MAKKLTEISSREELESGIFSAVDALKAPLWVSGSNVDFRNGRVEKARGWSVLQSGLVGVTAVAQALADDQKRLYFGNSDGLFNYVDGEEIYTLRSGMTAGRWSLLPWGRFLLATDNVSPLQLWPNTGTAANITDGPLRAKLLKALNVFVVALDCEGEEGRFEWCTDGNPEVWTPTLDNTAGGANLRDISSGIKAGEPFSNGLGLWTRDQMFLVSLVGGNDVMGYQRLAPDVGACGQQAVAVQGGVAYGVDERGFWATDGVTEKRIGQPAIWDTVGATIDFERGDEVVCYVNTARGTVEWNWRTPEGGRSGIAFGRDNGSWAPRDYGIEAAAAGAVFGFPVGTDGTDLRKLGDGVNAGSAALPASVTSKPLAFGDTDRYKYIDELRMQFSGRASLEIGLGESDEAVDEWLAAEELTKRHFPAREAAFWTLRFSSTGVDDTWAVEAVEIFGKLAGGRIWS